MSTTRIVLVLGSSAGGVGVHIAGLAREFAERGHRVGVIGPAETDALFRFSSIPGVKFAAVPIPAHLSLKETAAVSAVRALVAGFHADVVHAHGFRAGLLSALAIRRMRRSRRPRLVSTWHNAILSTGARRRLERGVARLIARSADVVLGASTDLVDLARELGAEHAAFAPAAAPTPTFGEDVNYSLARRRLLSELGLSPDAILVLTVGRVARQKDLGTLLDAAALWRQTHPRIHSIVAGGADAKVLEPLEARVRAERLPVRFLGQRQDVAALNIAADMVVLTSTWEARALVIQEAMLTGKAVIATAVGGLPELIGDAGILVPAGDAGAVADAVRALADDPARRSELGRQAAIRALDFPDEAHVADVIEEFYASRPASPGNPGNPKESTTP